MLRALFIVLFSLIFHSAVIAEELPRPIPPYSLEPTFADDDLLILGKRLKAKVFGSPTNSQYLLELSEVEGQLGQLDDAIKHARSAANIAPEDFRTHLLLAKLFILDRNALGSKLQAERALELMKRSDDRTAALCLQVSALVDLKEYAEADKLTASELKRNPKDARLAFLRAWTLSTNQAAQEAALDAYRQSLVIDPNLNQSHYNLGILLAHNGRKDAAVTELKTYLSGTVSGSSAKLAQELISNLADQD